VTAPRRYHYCASCRQGTTTLDGWAGLDATHLTPRSRQLIVLAGSDQSYDRASDRLWRMCGLRVSDQSVRRACQVAGEQAKAYLEQSDQAAEPVAQAQEQVECLMDGAKVNTTEGWREIRAVAICKRQPGPPADLRNWNDRYLPEPTASWSWAGIADASQTGKQLRAMADRLALGRGQGVSALADGAPWIWNQFDEHLPDHEGGLDVYHLSEHLHETGRLLHGQAAAAAGSEAAQRWAEQQRAALFRLGPRRYLIEHLLPLYEAYRREQPASAATKALRALLGYLWRHRRRLNYRDRLRRGLPIGSGQIEGVCKNTLNARLRKNNPRWRVENANRMAALNCLHYSRLWDRFWTHTLPQAA